MSQLKTHASAFDYRLQMLRGTDTFGARCYSYVLLAPKMPLEQGYVVHSGWGDPSDYDTQTALEKLKQHCPSA